MLGRLGDPEQAEAVRAEVREARRRGGLVAGEEQALAGLGIDLDEVVARVEVMPPARTARASAATRRPDDLVTSTARQHPECDR